MSLTNISNTIIGAGMIGDNNLDLTLNNRGTINGNGGGLTIDAAFVSNGGTLESTASGGLTIDADVSNTKTIAALGSGATLHIGNHLISGNGTAFASGPHAESDLAGAIFFGGTLETAGSGAKIATSGSFFSGVTIAGSSFVEILSGGTQELLVTTIGAGATVEVASGGVLSLQFATIGAGATIDPLNGGTALLGGVLTNSGIVEANGTARVVVSTIDLVTNAGTMETTASRGLTISAPFNNSKTIEALGSGASVLISGFEVVNFGAGMILASGSGAQIDLTATDIFSGTLKTSGANAMVVVSGGGNIFKTNIGGGTFVELATGVLQVTSANIGAGATIDALSGTELAVSGGKIGAGAVIETASGGTALILGTVNNSGGTLLASGQGSLVKITSGAVVSGGIAQIGDGIVEIAGSSGENVQFLSSGSGGLKIADTVGDTSAFSGRVSGFGGSGHSKPEQFIDLVSVTSAGVITSSYVSANGANTSGTLFISSGGTMVAAIKMVGSYSVGEFHITSGAGGTVAITDPTVPNGGSVAPGPAHNFPQGGVDLPNIAFGAQTTLAYAENAVGTGGTLTVSDGRHAASIALLGNYIAGSFIITADGHGGTLISEVQQTEQKPLLAHPAHG